MINRISAKIIADSINEFDDRLTTYVLTYPRIIHSEFMTHRTMSRNSASSRAIPFKTMLKKVQDEPFIPIAFQKEHKGMQGTEYFEDEELSIRQEWWKQSAKTAAIMAEELSKLGVTKQLCNRLLEPFLYHTVICTGTEWQNFFALRAHPQAEIHIADLAEKMLVAYNESKPKKLEADSWHIPFGDTFDDDRLMQLLLNNDERNVYFTTEQKLGYIEEYKKKISVARCARISYANFEGKDDYNADLKLYNQLVESGHMSPTEHVARAMNEEETTQYTITVPRLGKNNKPMYYFVETTYGQCKNYKGFIQLRAEIQGENKQDNRIKKW